MRRVGRLPLIVVCGIAAVGAVGLGFWQYGRLQTRRAANQVALTGRALPELSLNTLARLDSIDQRRASATGTFDYAHAFILWGRIERDAPGVHQVVPLRLAGRNDVVLVHRGFIPANDAVRPDTTTIDATAGERTVKGILLPVPRDPTGSVPLGVRGDTAWRRLDRAMLAARLPYPVLDVYLYETERENRPDSARPWPVPVGLPPLDDGPHLSYMVQWFGIAAAAAGFAWIFGKGKAGRDG